MAPLYTTDAGADGYINQGLTLLVEAYPWLVSEAEYQGALALGGYVHNVPNLRKAEEVWVDDGEDAFPLHHRTQRVIEKWYGTPLAVADQGIPADWADLVAGSHPTLETTTGQDLLLMPPADTAYTLHVRGLFRPAALVNNTDSNRVTVNYPDALIHAAWACYLRAQGNLEGFAAEWALIQSVEMREASRDHFETKAEEWADSDGLLEIL